MFLLVPAYPGCPGSKAVKRSLLLLLFLKPQGILKLSTYWICNGTVKEGCIPEDWKSSVVLPVYKGKRDPMECGSYRGIKLWEHAMDVVEGIFEHRI